MRITVNRTQLYVDVDGPQLVVDQDRLRTRPTIVALHGGPGFDQGYLRPGLAPLRELAQVIYVDLRGQGRSEQAPIETCTLEQMADDVAALCEHLGVNQPVVFGHSAGGFVALHLALRHPRRVGGLILCDTAPTLAPLPDDAPPPSLEDRAPAEAVQVASRLFGGDYSPATVEAFSRQVFPYYAGPTHQDVPAPLMSLSGFAPEVARHFFTRLAPDFDLRSRLCAVAVPSLVLVGRYDWVCPTAASRVLAAGIPDAKLIEVADAGHFVFSEEPRAFQEAVRGFLPRTRLS